jgi:hypothetical protein
MTLRQQQVRRRHPARHGYNAERTDGRLTRINQTQPRVDLDAVDDLIARIDRTGSVRGT